MNEAKKPARILVVDDEERNRRLLVAMLEAEGYSAAEAFDGTQALELARRNPPDAILLDIMMPGIDGYEVARQLKADVTTKAIPVVMVTALDDRDSRLRGLEAGAEEFVTKPVDRNELRIRVRNLLRLKEFSDFLANHNRILEEQVRERTAKVVRLNRVYAVLSGINTLIVRVHDRDELFRETCRLAAEEGRFGIAWIGTLDPATLDVNPIAWAGIDSEIIAHEKYSGRSDVPHGQGAVGRAIRGKRPEIVNDFATAPYHGGSPRREAIKRGYHSLATFPLLIDDAPVGVLTLFAQEPDFFDEAELKLLNELAGDIAFALDHIAKEEKLNYLAFYDALTGLPNRALFCDRVENLIRTRTEHEGRMAVLTLNVERFRYVNDSLGRPAGDALLRQIAERLREAIGDDGNLARAGSNTFAVSLAGVMAGAEVAHTLEEKILPALNRPFTVGGQELRLSFKGGVALSPNDGSDAEALFQNAEAALQKAKDSGDNYMFYAPQMNARIAEILSLENKLHIAVVDEQFVLHYQPKVDLANNRITGLEALIRWDSPEMGLVPPAEFIPILEETGMIVEVGAWAMKQAVSQYAAWQAAGLQPPPIAVNVSQVQLKRRDFVASVEQAIAIAGKPEHGLDLEITESMIMEDIESSIEKLKTIRELGVGISIDDFGTGYSSLRYLTRLPITALKIDRAFIQHMTTNADDVAIVTTVIALGHNLNLKVIAEGVETEEQRKFLQLLKCDEFQGYLFSKPVPAEQVPALLKRP